MESFCLLFEFGFNPVNAILKRKWMQTNPLIVTEMRGTIAPNHYAKLVEKATKFFQDSKKNVSSLSVLALNDSFQSLRVKLGKVFKSNYSFKFL